MRIINISVCVLVFCLMTTAQEDSLGSDYNLGRVTGPGVTMNDLGLYINEGVLLTDIFHRQVGKEDHLSFGFTVGGLGMFASGGGLGAFLFPEFDIHARIGPSSRIWAMIMPVNFFFVFGRGGGGTGFEFPFYMFNAYHWSLLSNKGKITLPKDQREHAFLFGPLLNSKQFRIDVGMFHTIRGDKDLGGIIAPSARLLVGILDNLQIGGKFLYKNLQEYQSVERDSLGFGFQVDLRHRIMGYSLFYDFLLNERGTKEFNNLIGTRLDLIVGERITSTDQVRGNWDGYFSPVLGKMQLVNTLLLKFIIKKWEYEQGPEAKQNRLDLFDMISFGVTEHITLGASYALDAKLSDDQIGQKARNATQDMHLLATAMNIPLRKKGPSEASKFEYVFGLYPGGGQIKAELNYRIPFDGYGYGGIRRDYAIEHLSDNAFGAYELQSYLDDSISLSNDDRYTKRYAGSLLLKESDLSCRLAVGITDQVIFHNTFESIFGDNFVYADHFGFSFGDPKRNLVSLMTLFVGQSRSGIDADGNTYKRGKFDFLINILYQAAF